MSSSHISPAMVIYMNHAECFILVLGLVSLEEAQPDIWEEYEVSQGDFRLG